MSGRVMGTVPKSKKKDYRELPHTNKYTSKTTEGHLKRSPDPSGRDIRCFKCGKGGHMQYQCPDLGMEQCDRSGTRGYFTKDCRTIQRRLALGMRGRAAKRYQKPPPRRPNVPRNPPNAPHAPMNAPTAPQALRNATDAPGPATKGKGKGTVDPTPKMGQFSMV